MGKWIKEKVNGFFDGMVGGVMKLLGMNSPSKVFAGIGENMALGLGAGFGDEMSNITDEMGKQIPTSFDMPGVNVNGTTSAQQKA